MHVLFDSKALNALNYNSIANQLYQKLLMRALDKYIYIYFFDLFVAAVAFSRCVINFWANRFELYSCSGCRGYYGCHDLVAESLENPF